jgi:hypothetical protein
VTENGKMMEAEKRNEKETITELITQFYSSLTTITILTTTQQRGN